MLLWNCHSLSSDMWGNYLDRTTMQYAFTFSCRKKLTMSFVSSFLSVTFKNTSLFFAVQNAIKIEKVHLIHLYPHWYTRLNRSKSQKPISTVDKPKKYGSLCPVHFEYSGITYTLYSFIRVSLNKNWLYATHFIALNMYNNMVYCP